MKHCHKMPKDDQINTSPANDDIIIYYTNGAVRIDLANILTIDKIIHRHMLLIKQEVSHFNVVKVLDVWNDNEFVYIRIQDRKTCKIGNICHILDRTVNYYVWSLISLEYIKKRLIELEMLRAIVGS